MRILMKNLKETWTNLKATEQSEKFHVRHGHPSIISFVVYSQRLVLRPARKGALNSWLAHTMHALFSVCSLRDDNVITSKPTWKLKHANSILEPFEYFCQIPSKLVDIISSYTVSKLGCFLRHSVHAISLQRQACQYTGDMNLHCSFTLNEMMFLIVIFIICRP